METKLTNVYRTYIELEQLIAIEYMLMLVRVCCILWCMIVILGYTPHEVKTLQVELALSNLNKLNFEDAFRILENSPSSNFLVGDAPFLHHLFNLYMLAKNTKDKKQVIELLHLGITKGIDVKMTHNTHYEPDLLYKSIFIRNMTISQAIVKQLSENPGGALTNSDTQHLLSVLSCDAVPLAKMLLHGSNIIAQSSHYLDTEASIREMIKLLSDAILSDKSSKFAYNGLELSKYSSSYKVAIELLVKQHGNTHQTNDLSLAHLTSILQDMSTSILRPLWTQEAILQDLEGFLSIIVKSNDRKRNVLHMLAISNCASALQIIYDRMHALLYDPLVHQIVVASGAEDDVDAYSNRLKELLLHALVKRDVRGHSPISLAYSRYGANSATYFILVNLFHLSTTPTKEMLAQRIHAPSGEEVEPVDGTSFEANYENYEELIQVMEILDYVKSPLLPKPLLESVSASSLGSPYYSVIRATNQSVTDMKTLWRNMLNNHGDWSSTLLTDVLMQLPGPDSNPILSEYVDSYPLHYHEVNADIHSNNNSDTMIGQYPLDYCDFEQVYLSELPSPEEFYYLYVNPGKPVIFRGVALDTHIRYYK